MGALGHSAPARCDLCPRRVYGRRHLSTPEEFTSGIELGPLGGARLRMSGSFPQAIRGTVVVGRHALGLCPDDWTFRPIVSTRAAATKWLWKRLDGSSSHGGCLSRARKPLRRILSVSTLTSVWADAGQGRDNSCLPAFPCTKATQSAFGDFRTRKCPVFSLETPGPHPSLCIPHFLAKLPPAAPRPTWRKGFRSSEENCFHGVPSPRRSAIERQILAVPEQGS